jgi:hypothetical protein
VKKRYQLVLQFPCVNGEDYHSFVALEDDFYEAVGDSAIVDGHDCGSGEFNIFVHTDTPAETFTQLFPALFAARRLSEVRVAIRPFSSQAYRLIWPEGDSSGFSIA